MKPIQLCHQCGESFQPKRSTARFCSARCRKAAQRERSTGPAQGDPYLMKCTICQVEFLATRADARFCCSTCRTYAHRQREDAYKPWKRITQPPAPALWREGEGLERVREAKAAGRVWDRRSWAREW